METALSPPTHPAAPKPGRRNSGSVGSRSAFPRKSEVPKPGFSAEDGVLFGRRSKPTRRIFGRDTSCCAGAGRGHRSTACVDTEGREIRWTDGNDCQLNGASRGLRGGGGRGVPRCRGTSLRDACICQAAVFQRQSWSSCWRWVKLWNARHDSKHPEQGHASPVD